MALAIAVLPLRAATSLIDMVPKDIDGCLWLDITAIMTHPMVAEQIEKQQDKDGLRQFRELFARHGLDFNRSFPQGILFGNRDGQGAMLLQTTIEEAKFRAMFEEDPMNVVGLLDGRATYAHAGKDGHGGSVSMYLRPDVIVSAKDADALSAYREAVKAGTLAGNAALSQYRRKVAPNAHAWAVFVQSQPEADASPQQHMFGMVKGGSLALFLGSQADAAKKDDLRVVVRLACKDAQGASFGALSLNGLLMVGIGQALAGDPELGTEMSRLLQLRPEQQDIVLDATFTGPLISRLQKAMENRVSGRVQGLSAGGDDALTPSATDGDDGLLPLPPEAE